MLATGVDFAARVALGFNMARIAIAETLLFVCTSALLTWWAITSPLKSKAIRRVEWVLAAVFGLAAIRAGLLAGRIPVFVVNLITLVVAVLVCLGWFVCQRSIARDRAARMKDEG